MDFMNVSAEGGFKRSERPGEKDASPAVRQLQLFTDIAEPTRRLRPRDSDAFSPGPLLHEVVYN